MSVPLLVSCEWLQEHIVDRQSDGRDIVLIDVSWSSQKNCYDEFKLKHIPGAQFVDVMDATHCDTYPRNIPTPETFTQNARAAGVNTTSHVVVYSDTDVQGFFMSGRGWWTFKYFGQENVSVLDGGLQKWLQCGYSVTDVIDAVQPGDFTANVQSEYKKELEYVASSVDKPDFQLLDTRKNELHTKNSIPGAKNLPLHTLLDTESGTLKSAEQLKQMFVSAGIDLTKPLVTHCNSGMSSCSVALAAKHAGATDVSLFHGGFNEWSKKGPAN